MITFNMESWTINRVNSLKDKIGMLSACDPEVIRFKEKKARKPHEQKHYCVAFSSHLLQNLLWEAISYSNLHYHLSQRSA